MKQLLLSVLLMISTATLAEPLTLPYTTDTFQLGNHAFPTKVEVVGVEINPTSIFDSYTYLEGPDLRGWMARMDDTNIVKLIFQQPIDDMAGDDLYIGQGRLAEYEPPVDPRHAMEFSFDGETWHYLTTDDFEMASTYWFLPKTESRAYYQLHKATIDFAYYGVTEPVTEIYVRGVTHANLVLVGNMNQYDEFDEYAPIVNLFNYAGSFTQNNKVKYTGFYQARIFAHDASGIKKTILYQRVKGESKWNRVDMDDNLSSTIGGYFGGYYSVYFDYKTPAYPVGTVLQFKHVTIDNAGQRHKVIKRVRVKKNGGLKLLN